MSGLVFSRSITRAAEVAALVGRSPSGQPGAEGAMVAERAVAAELGFSAYAAATALALAEARGWLACVERGRPASAGIAPRPGRWRLTEAGAERLLALAAELRASAELLEKAVGPRF
jgi:hypothetical protein